MTTRFDNLPEDVTLAKSIVQVEEREGAARVATGALGKLFGTGKNAANNIGGVLLIFMVFASCLYAIFAKETAAFTKSEFFAVLVPLITLILGYLFGADRPDEQ